ncbi:MAG: LLM class F420-dependent oxidoreductase [Proteobacteria bacterium]|nr:LLM class F420-dependent oxidoreductase [Pseudomonadota bacterium]
MTPTPNMVPLAVAADQAGWSMATLSDHVVNVETPETPYPYTPDGKRRWPEFTEFPDQFVMIAAMAAVTKRLAFTTNAFVLPMRDPFSVAKSLATLSALSGGRISPSIGVGWSRDEFDILGRDFSNRGKRCDEMIEVMRLLWSGEYVEYHGRFYSFARLEMNPKPAKPIPLWIGGMSDAAHRRAARLGDGWLSDWQPSAEILATVEKIRGYRREYGREQLPFDVMATPADVFDPAGYRRLETAGITHIIAQPWQIYYPGTTDLAKQLESVRRFADEVIAHAS